MPRGKCEKCGEIRELQRNHLDGNSNNNSPGNVEMWCADCHMKYHQYPKGQNQGTPLRGN